MSTFALDRNYQQFNFEEISVDELQIISGGSGGVSDRCLAAVAGGAIGGAIAGAAVFGFFGGLAGALGGGLSAYGTADSCG